MPFLTSRFPGSFVQDSVPPETTADSQPQIHLRTPQHDELLDLIDLLRSQGITRYIDLPQLIVCGDQSAGKSSVLEAISGGLRFPTKDSLCTRFAIELILRRSPTTQVNVSIVPDEERTKEEKDSLANFEPPTVCLDEFPLIIDAAAEAMGIDGTRKSFSKDILRVELSGPSQPHLTLVDLPGLYHAGDEHQSRKEVKAIHSLVKSYMGKDRSIVLAVVSAKNDYNNQIVTEYAREADPKGHRTLGIITKPDMLHSGSNTLKAFQSLVTDEETRFKLGWHVLRNRDYNTRGSTTEERDKAEEDFFENDDWKHIAKDRLGIQALRKRLSDILLAHILKELPRLLQDVQNGIASCEQRLKSLGASRRTLESQRTYLFQASQMFTTLMRASVDGTYRDAFFATSDTEEGYRKRLRAVVQNIMKGFAQEMRLRGHALHLVDHTPSQEEAEYTTPKLINREEFLKYVEVRMNRDRGRELPGTFNPDIIGSLFFDQAKPWKGIMHYTREQLVKATETTINLLLEHVADPTTAQAIHLLLIQPNMEVVANALAEKVDEILQPHLLGHPLTFNHYFIDNIQKKRRDETRRVLANKLHAFFGKDPEAQLDSNRIYDGQFNVRALLDSLVLRTEVDFERFACVEATNAMEAYYKVALKTVIDAFGMYAIEATLLEKLTTVFNPEVVFNLDNATVTKVASESAESIIEREDLEKKLSTLQDSLRTLQRMKIRKVSHSTPRRGAVAQEEEVHPVNAASGELTNRAERSNSTASQDSGIAIGTEEQYK